MKEFGYWGHGGGDGAENSGGFLRGFEGDYREGFQGSRYEDVK